MKLTKSDDYKSGRLHGKHVVAIWNLL